MSTEYQRAPEDSYEESLWRLNKAGGDVCRALGVYAENQVVVNALVAAVRHHDAEKIRMLASAAFETPEAIRASLRSAADLIDPDKE